MDIYNQDQNNEARLLAQQINQSIDLPSFIEKLTKKPVRWQKAGMSAVMNCPFSWHDDKNASFRINLMEDGAWVYHCFGCHSSGKALQFYLEFTGEQDYQKAVYVVANEFKIALSGNPVPYSKIGNVIDKKKKLETEHILVAVQCRELLKKNFEKHKQWVFTSYKNLNIALDECDKDAIEKIGNEASERINL